MTQRQRAPRPQEALAARKATATETVPNKTPSAWPPAVHIWPRRLRVQAPQNQRPPGRTTTTQPGSRNPNHLMWKMAMAAYHCYQSSFRRARHAVERLKRSGGIAVASQLELPWRQLQWLAVTPGSVAPSWRTGAPHGHLKHRRRCRCRREAPSLPTRELNLWRD